jgi:ribosomal protein L12E/L44/L45/RPP1/RPP2
MTDKDFRYTMPDGNVVEAFQLTPQTRYAAKSWPEWMDSRYLVTYEGGEERLVINNVETKIPKLGWIVKQPDGAITAVDYSMMERADKVVKEDKVVHPEAKVDEEALLKLGAKLTGKSVDELREEQEAQKAAAPTVAPAPPAVTGQTRNTDDLGLLNEARGVFDLMRMGKHDEAQDKLKSALTTRAQWCDCPPGGCNGKADVWDCRANSPLVLT